MKVLAITQARTGSSRLPNKVLKIIQGQTLLETHIERILQSKRIDKLVVATTTDTADDLIEKLLLEKNNLSVYRGSVNNVLDRFYQAAEPYRPEWIVRLTSDCPLLDPCLLDSIIDKAIEANVDYCSNTLMPTYPDGMDVEVCKFSALEKAWKEADLDSEKEHVTPYIHKNSTFNGKTLFTSFNYANNEDYSSVRLTVDEQADFEVIQKLIEELGKDKNWKAYADQYLNDQSIKDINHYIIRNEGYAKSLHKD
jgi:spore coat polysaccharide biosynthesis protein SpsF